MACEISIVDIWRYGGGREGVGGVEELIDRVLGGQRALPSAIYCNLTSMGKKKQSPNLHIFHLHTSPGLSFFYSPSFFIIPVQF